VESRGPSEGRRTLRHVEHDDTPFLIDALRPVVLGLRPHIEHLDEATKARIVAALSEALTAGYRAGAAGATFIAETIAAREGFELRVPPLQMRPGGGEDAAEAA
jgi:hypothetical protein